MIQVTSVQIDPIRVVMLRHTGPYDQISTKFDKLYEWSQSHRVPVQRWIATYYDNPEYTDAASLRSAACAEVPSSFLLTDSGGLPLEVGNIKGGKYATATHRGSYEGLGQAWSELTRYAERVMSATITEDPAFEIYVNDPSDTPEDQLITELYMPVN